MWRHHEQIISEGGVHARYHTQDDCVKIKDDDDGYSDFVSVQVVSGGNPAKLGSWVLGCQICSVMVD